MLLTIATKSLQDRKATVLLTLFSIVLSVFLFISVEHIRSQTKNSFNRTVSGVDLIVGARTSSISLLLNSVFRIGYATNSVSWQSFQHFTEHPQVKWAIPLALGDSHQGYPVLGTNHDYFSHYQYGDKQPLVLQQGAVFEKAQQLVLGADVAEELNYHIGDELVLSHGVAKISFSQHKQHPFTVVGILQATGTPIDKTLHINITDIDGLHQVTPSLAGGRRTAGMDNHGQLDTSPEINTHEHAEKQTPPSQISAFLLGLQSRIAVLTVQREINQFKQQALSAVLPGVALTELWSIVGGVEKVLGVISVLVLCSSMLGLCAILLASLKAREPELKVLRIVGATPITLCLLLQLEALLITCLAVAIGMLLTWLSFTVASPLLSEHYGLFIDSNIFTVQSLWFCLMIILAGMLVSVVPALTIYRNQHR
ncbi:ABC transporter permease [Aliiglaciecola sp. LCG003]|uniref:ABC transporter permease n=1 Tax=Aliiglaciecola sp. LCG003 TaxID=3053655 RepID=UPI0025736E98|nr:ABC transporter permease [Aliiglaciecola sp. LCG003]WJG10811.1 ABC transporter permease [Aliiglaciecola sp. LCG003]